MNHIKKVRTRKFFIIHEGFVALEEFLCYNWDCEPREYKNWFSSEGVQAEC